MILIAIIFKINEYKLQLNHRKEIQKFMLNFKRENLDDFRKKIPGFSVRLIDICLHQKLIIIIHCQLHSIDRGLK